MEYEKEAVVCRVYETQEMEQLTDALLVVERGKTPIVDGPYDGYIETLKARVSFSE